MAWNKTFTLAENFNNNNAFDTSSALTPNMFNVPYQNTLWLYDNKVDKVQGKGLSTNDFTNSFKDAVNANTTNRHSHSNKATLDKITEAFTTELKAKVDKAIQEGDSRLTNSRPASDVYSWAKASSKPTYKWSEITEKPTLLQKGNLTSTDNGANFGTCQMVKTLPSGLSGVYNYGTYISFAQDNGRFEIYAPHEGTNNEHIYVRTGWDNDRKKWEKLAFVKDIPSLSDYVTSDTLSSTLSNYVTSSALSTSLSSYVTSSSLNSTLGSYVTSSGLLSTLSSYATQTWVKGNDFLHSSEFSNALAWWLFDSGWSHYDEFADFIVDKILYQNYPTFDDLTYRLNSYVTSSSLSTSLSQYTKTSGVMRVDTAYIAAQNLNKVYSTIHFRMRLADTSKYIQIEIGHIQIGSPVQETSKTISFVKTFPTPPIVVCSPISNNTSNYYLQGAVTGVTSSGFTVKYHGNASNDKVASIMYIAAIGGY